MLTWKVVTTSKRGIPRSSAVRPTAKYYKKLASLDSRVGRCVHAITSSRSKKPEVCLNL